MRSAVTVPAPFLFSQRHLLHLTYEYRLRPSRAQYAALERLLEMTRVLYNAALEARISKWTYAKRLVARRGSDRPDAKLDGWTPDSYVTQCAEMTRIRADDPEGYGALPSTLCREPLKRVDLAFKAFFRRVSDGQSPGFPRFKGKGRWRSFGLTEFSGIRLIGSKLHFAGVCGGLAVHMHRPLPADCSIRAARFSRDAQGWKVSLQLGIAEQQDAHVRAWRGDSRPAVGVDLGILSFAALSNGESIANPRVGRRAAAMLKRRQQALARCKRGSRRRRKVARSVARSHLRLGDARRTFLHQQSARLARTYGTIVVEQLQLRNMTRSAKGTIDEPGTMVRQKAGLNRELLDVALSSFINMLRYKAERAGGEIIEVKPHGTSQTCSGCGATVPKDLSARMHDCPHCGLSIDRDLNAARNILARARLRAVVGPELNAA